MKKLASRISEIRLNSTTFKGTRTTINPTYVNFFFGNNGAGKSTIAKAIQSGKDIAYASGKTKADFLTLVYDKEFVNNNISDYRKLPGIYTIGEENKKIQEEIEKIQKEKISPINDEIAKLEEEQKKNESAIKEKLDTLHTECWDKTRELNRMFKNTQKGAEGSKELFYNEVKKYHPINHDLDKLRVTYDAIYDKNARHYLYFNVIENTAILDEIDDYNILEKVITNTAQTDFAVFLKELGATEWFQTAHKEFHSKTDKCPYCARPLQENFDEIVKQSFDDVYRKDLQKIEKFLTAYKDNVKKLRTELSKPQEIHPGINTKAYDDKLDTLNALLDNNIHLIEQKIAESNRIIHLSKTEPIIRDLVDIITKYNEIIEANNSAINADASKFSECRRQVFEYMAFILKDEINKCKNLTAELSQFNIENKQKIKEEESKRKPFQERINDLREKIVNTTTAINNINTILHDSGFYGFEIRAQDKMNYQIIRTETGNVVEGLSEGERNFIAFLYFQQKVFGSEKKENDTREKIVVIDDPVSSMDSKSLFIVGEQIRKMIEICRNNADSENARAKDNFIKQIFILTHNAYFHREITYSYVNYYNFISFYLIKKLKTRSSVVLCVKSNPNEPSENVNYNPIKNSYAALWEEYKELKNVASAVPLLNVIRRILEYYFVQICGYDRDHIRNMVFERNKDKYIRDENGRIDDHKYDIANAMLRYIASNSYELNDSSYFVDEAIDTDLYEKTFQMIFKFMGQEQHFNMMMEIKK